MILNRKSLFMSIVKWIDNQKKKSISDTLHWISRSTTRRAKNSLPKRMPWGTHWNFILCHWNKSSINVQSKSNDVPSSSPSSPSFDEFRARTRFWQRTWKGELFSFEWQIFKFKAFTTNSFALHLTILLIFYYNQTLSKCAIKLPFCIVHGR